MDGERPTQSFERPGRAHSRMLSQPLRQRHSDGWTGSLGLGSYQISSLKGFCGFTARSTTQSTPASEQALTDRARPRVVVPYPNPSNRTAICPYTSRARGGSQSRESPLATIDRRAGEGARRVDPSCPNRPCPGVG